jgi:hypothetical protein
MSTEVPANEVKSWDDMKNPGDFIFSTDKDGKIWGMIEMCPCGCGATGGIFFDTGDPNQASPKWKWNGDKVKPTLTPSIQRTGGCKWHGFLTDGVFKTC